MKPVEGPIGDEKNHNRLDNHQERAKQKESGSGAGGAPLDEIGYRFAEAVFDEVERHTKDDCGNKHARDEVSC